MTRMIAPNTWANRDSSTPSGIAQHIQMLSSDVLRIEEGSLYPALQRMLVKGVGGGRVEDLGKQPPSALLHAHLRRSEVSRSHKGAVN